MSPRTEEQFEEIRESKKELIMETALELFAKEGYYPTSISQIAKKAGISKGLMYNYFESKEELIKEIIYKGIDDILENFDPNHDGILTQDEFIFYIKETFSLINSNVSFWKLFMAIVMQPSVYPLIENKVHDISPGLLQTLTNYFIQKFGDNANTEMIMFTCVIKGAIMQYLYSPDIFPLEEIQQKIIDMYT